MTSTPPLPRAIFSPTLPQTPPPLSGMPSASNEQHEEDPSPPPSPTPASAAAAGAGGSSAVLQLAAIRMRAISPPTPAPSPQPFHQTNRFPPVAHAGWSSPPDERSEEDVEGMVSSEEAVVQSMRSKFGAMSSPMRLRLLSFLIADSPPSSLSPLLPLITPRLKRDFLKTLPLELAFHVLSFVDDVRTLARASGVSRFWRALLEDEGTWKRMCWKSGFGDTEVGEMVGSPVTAGQRLRSLEFGEREEEDGTPAGRERRGTLDRSSLLEFAARAEFFGLRSDSPAPADIWQVPVSMPEVSVAEVQAISGTAGSTGLGLGTTITTVQSTLAERRARSSRARSHGQEAQPTPVRSQTHARMSETHGSPTAPPGSLPFSPSLTTNPIASTSAAVHPPLQALVSPPMPALSMSLPNYSLRSPSRSQPMTSISSPSVSGPPSAKKPFSYKTHFKRAYLTESAWLRGPGRLLSTQMSADDGVVTSLGFDNEWIVVGMATSKVHIFEAATGSYVKTLDGHELGVWCLTLVSKNGGPKDDNGKGKERAANDWTNSFASKLSQPSPMGASFSQPGMRARDDTAFTNDSPAAGSSFFRNSREEPTSSSSTPINPPTSPPRRRRSFQGFGSGGEDDSTPSSDAPRTGGMGLGAGGETGDSAQQAGVCGTARGWGQKGAVVVSGGCDRDVRVWDVESGTCKHVLRGHSSTVRCMRVIDGRPIAVSGSRDATLRVWNIEKGTAMHQLVGHSHSVRCIEVSGNKVVSGSYDATCRLWDVDTGECLFVYRGHIHQIYAVAFDGIRVVTGSLDSTVRIWSATTGEFLALLQGHTSLVGQLQLDPISNVLVTGGSDGRVIVFSLTTFDTIHRLCAHDNSVTCLQFDDRFIVTGGNDGRIKLWDMKSGAFIRELAEPSDAIWRVTFRDDKHVVLCRREGKTLMDVRTFRPSEEELG